MAAVVVGTVAVSINPGSTGIGVLQHLGTGTVEWSLNPGLVFGQGVTIPSGKGTGYEFQRPVGRNGLVYLVADVAAQAVRWESY